MRRIMLFVLLALVLPTAALASSIDFSTGSFDGGTISRTASGGFGVSGSAFNVHVLGDTTTISLTGATLSAGCNVFGNGSCTFTGGSVKVTTPTGTLLFSDAVEGTGMITKTATSAIIFAMLVPNAGTPVSLGPSGGFARFAVNFSSAGPPFSSHLTEGSAARVAALPEPGTLGLLGTGLIGLAGMVRRKFKPGTKS